MKEICLLYNFLIEKQQLHTLPILLRKLLTFPSKEDLRRNDEPDTVGNHDTMRL